MKCSSHPLFSLLGTTMSSGRRAAGRRFLSSSPSSSSSSASPPSTQAPPPDLHDTMADGIGAMHARYVNMGGGTPILLNSLSPPQATDGGAASSADHILPSQGTYVPPKASPNVVEYSKITIRGIVYLNVYLPSGTHNIIPAWKDLPLFSHY